MSFFFDYEAKGNVTGHVRLSSGTTEEAFLYATNAIRGLDCIRGILRCGESMWDTQDQWAVIARYTRNEGWKWSRGV